MSEAAGPSSNSGISSGGTASKGSSASPTGELVRGTEADLVRRAETATDRCRLPLVRIGEDDFMRYMIIATALVLLIGGSHPSLAAKSCTGTYHARSLQPLPVPTIVALDIRDASSRNLDLAARFTDGLHRAGVSTGGVPNSRMELTARISGTESEDRFGAPNNPAASAARGNELGERLRVLPEMPRLPLLDHRGKPRIAPALFLRAELVEADTHKVLWLAIVHCTMAPVDDKQLAYDLGVLVGASLGRTVGQTSF